MLGLLRTQLEKDFFQATFVEVAFDAEPLVDFVQQVRQEIQRIIVTDASKFSNLLYRVDIPEQALEALKGMAPEDYWSHITYLILKREWQKVWIRNKLL